MSAAELAQCEGQFQVQDFVVWTASGHDEGTDMHGTVQECSAACCADPTCVGFSRPKDSNTGQTLPFLDLSLPCVDLPPEGQQQRSAFWPPGALAYTRR